MAALQNHYETIEVAEDADVKAIKKAYRKLVLKWHPDKNPEDRDAAEEKIRQLNAAYEILSNPAKREAYDAQLKAATLQASGWQPSSQGPAPRMSIPKDFMLQPMTHPEKFVRIVGKQLFCQTREDVETTLFLDFFNAAKYSLWWLPEVNNMCRLNHMGAQTAHVSFSQLEAGRMSESVVEITGLNQPAFINLIAGRSPAFEGAFRFEAAYQGGHYLTFVPPMTMKVMPFDKDEPQQKGNIIDFCLLDFNMMFKFITINEVLVPVLQSLGADKGYINIQEVKESQSIIQYFSGVRAEPVWDREDFETFFEAHFEKFDSKDDEDGNLLVKLRSKEERLAAQIRRATDPKELVKVISETRDCNDLPLSTALHVLQVLDGDEEDGVSAVVNRMAARKKMVLSLPKILKREAGDLKTVLAISHLIPDMSLMGLENEERCKKAIMYALSDSALDALKDGEKFPAVHLEALLELPDVYSCAKYVRFVFSFPVSIFFRIVRALVQGEGGWRLAQRVIPFGRARFASPSYSFASWGAGGSVEIGENAGGTFSG